MISDLVILLWKIVGLIVWCLIMDLYFPSLGINCMILGAEGAFCWGVSAVFRMIIIATFHAARMRLYECPYS